MTNTEKNSNFYNNMFKIGGYNHQFFKDPEKAPLYPVWSKVLDNINKDEKIIDLGCGPGQFAQLAFRRNKNYIIGIDFSKEAIEMAKKRNPKHQNKFVLGDIKTSSLHDINYDVVVLCEILEHIINDLEIIEKVAQNRRIIISLPSFGGEGHVRYFNNQKSIIDRYKNLIDIKYISEIPIRSSTFYIIIGTRK